MNMLLHNLVVLNYIKFNSNFWKQQKFRANKESNNNQEINKNKDYNIH